MKEFLKSVNISIFIDSWSHGVLILLVLSVLLLLLLLFRQRSGSRYHRALYKHIKHDAGVSRMTEDGKFVLQLKHVATVQLRLLNSKRSGTKIRRLKRAVAEIIS